MALQREIVTWEGAIEREVEAHGTRKGKHNPKTFFCLLFMFPGLMCLWEQVCLEKALFLLGPFCVAAAKKSHAVQDVIRTQICLLLPASVQAWASCLLHRQPKPLRSTLLQQMGWTWGGDRREGTRWGPCHTQAGWSEPLPDSWDQFGQNSRLCEAKA